MIQLLRAAPSAQYFPPDLGKEIAFCGRSNAGKSSVLNLLCGRRALSRVSRVPGRTQEILFFELLESIRLADLPGYGYAAVSAQTAQRMRRLLESYLERRQSLCGVVQVVDMRHSNVIQDRLLREDCQRHGIPLLVLLNKADKVASSKRHVLKKALQSSGDEAHGEAFECLVFSASNGLGLEALQSKLNLWLKAMMFGVGGALEKKGVISRRG